MSADVRRAWEGYCEGAQRVDERFGRRKALGYLIGEKLIDLLRTARIRSGVAEEIPRFAADVRAMFPQADLKEYLENVRRLGAWGHILSDEKFAAFRRAGTIVEDPVAGAEDILLLERVKELLLDP